MGTRSGVDTSPVAQGCPRGLKLRVQYESHTLRISKAGNTYLRRLLVGSANYILGPFGPDCELRRWGMKLSERGDKNARKRAKVAGARLAVLLHKLWVSGEGYEPLPEKRAAA